ncbi:MAG: hypothetical protein M3019_06590, partial [Candidatus Dormibacteraeota bacterium]|nr:hypothetical protein [Candidatus Dormibacteraeota bacterium]
GHLSNWDKHRLPHLTGSFLRSVAYFSSDSLPMPGLIAGPFNDNAPVMWLRLPLSDTDMNMEPLGVFDIAFEKEWPGMGRPVRDTLRGLAVFVDDVISRLEPFCWRLH